MFLAIRWKIHYVLATGEHGSEATSHRVRDRKGCPTMPVDCDYQKRSAPDYQEPDVKLERRVYV